MTLPGWTCEQCHCFNGEAKELLVVCRACNAVRPNMNNDCPVCGIENERLIAAKATIKALRLGAHQVNSKSNGLMFDLADEAFLDALMVACDE